MRTERQREEHPFPLSLSPLHFTLTNLFLYIIIVRNETVYDETML